MEGATITWASTRASKLPAHSNSTHEGSEAGYVRWERVYSKRQSTLLQDTATHMVHWMLEEAKRGVLL